MADILLGNVKGPQGDTGATGSQGPQGDAATITVGTVSTTAYGNTAQVINSGTEQDAVLDFVIPQGKPGEQTTRMGALTLDTITAQSADFPIPAVGETGSTVFGKIIKFFNSTISALNSKLNISDVVNNLTSTSTTKPLSSAQGKALNDALGKWIFGGSTESFRVANNSTATDIAMRAIHSNGAYSSLTVAENKIELLSADSGGSTTQKLCVLFDHLQVPCNGSATTSVTITNTLINYTARRILACVNGGSDNGAYITKAIPVGTKTVDLYWSKALPTSGTVHVTLLYW